MDFPSSIFLPDEPLVCEEMMERKRQGKSVLKISRGSGRSLARDEVQSWRK